MEWIQGFDPPIQGAFVGGFIALFGGLFSTIIYITIEHNRWKKDKKVDLLKEKDKALSYLMNVVMENWEYIERPPYSSTLLEVLIEMRIPSSERYKIYLELLQVFDKKLIDKLDKKMLEILDSSMNDDEKKDKIYLLFIEERKKLYEERERIATPFLSIVYNRLAIMIRWIVKHIKALPSYVKRKTQ